MTFFFNDLFKSLGMPGNITKAQSLEAIRSIDQNYDGGVDKSELFTAFKMMLNKPSQPPPQPVYGHQPMYGQQPMYGKYAQPQYGYNQPNNSMYGNQPNNSMYGNQPNNSMYGNQPNPYMQSQYGQPNPTTMNNSQSNNMYGQPQPNQMYGQPPNQGNQMQNSQTNPYSKWWSQISVNNLGWNIFDMIKSRYYKYMIT